MPCEESTDFLKLMPAQKAANLILFLNIFNKEYRKNMTQLHKFCFLFLILLLLLFKPIIRYSNNLTNVVREQLFKINNNCCFSVLKII